MGVRGNVVEGEREQQGVERRRGDEGTLLSSWDRRTYLGCAGAIREQ